MREIRYWLTAPDGTVYDITSRADIESQGTLIEETEDDLLQFTYGNIDLTLDDRDEFLSGLFDSAEHGDVFRIEIERETGRRRPKWERLFAGVLDVEGSVTRDDAAKTVDVSAYSLAKLLEAADASSLKRSIVGRTGTVSVGATLVTVTDTTGLEVDDQITLGTGDYTETQTILSIDSTTTLHTYTAFTNSFTDAVLTLVTPYLRKRTVADLARQVYGLAGFTSVSVDVAAELETVPFATSLRSSGLPGGAPTGMAERSSAIAVWQSGHRYSAADVDTGFSDAGVDAAKLDWRPYLASEPVTFQAGSRTQIRDYVSAGHELYELRIDDDGTNYRLRVYKAGVLLVEVDTTNHTAPEPNGQYIMTSFEVAAAWGEVWVSWTKTTQSTHKVWDGEGWIWETTYLTGRGMKRYDTSGSLLQTWNLISGRLRFVAADGQMAVDRHDTALLQFYDHGSVSRSGSGGSLDMWTFRKFGAFYAAITTGPPYAVVLIDAASLAELGRFPVSTNAAGSSEATVFTKGGLISPEYEGYAGGKWFSVSLRASGVVPYFDCEGKSAAAALRSLAMFAAAHAWIDEDGIGYVIGRSAAFNSLTYALEIGQPIGAPKRRPFWEWWRRSVRVGAKDETGADVEAFAGDVADSASRPDVDCDIPMSASYCGVVASAYARLLGRTPVPRQSDETIDEPPDGRVRLLGKVTRDGVTMLAMRVESDLRGETQDVSLAEVG